MFNGKISMILVLTECLPELALAARDSEERDGLVPALADLASTVYPQVVKISIRKLNIKKQNSIVIF